MHSFLVPAFLYLALYFPAALSFSVTVGSSPTQCGSLNLTWTGGHEPFKITLTPAFDVPMNITVPSTAFSNNQGSYQISPFPFFNQTKFLATMSDATGFGTGGTSNLLTVGLPVEGASCTIYSPALSYTFGLPSALQQCSSYTFNGYDGASLPVTVTGFIPGGESFSLQSPSSGTSFSWIADVIAGTTIIFTMTDAQGRSGGSSDSQVVADSNSASCLNATSPSSTINHGPSSTSASSSTSSSPAKVSIGVSTGTIVGVAIGAVLAVSIVVALAICCLKRQRFERYRYGLAPTLNSRRPNSVELDPGTDNFQHPPIYPFPYQSDSDTRLTPPIVPGSHSVPGSSTSYHDASSMNPSILSSERPPHSSSSPNTDNFGPFGGVASSSMSSSGRRKAAMAGMTTHQLPARFVVHTDMDDDVPEVETGVIELPPQYSERRTPVVTQTGDRPMSSASLAYLSEHSADEPLQTAPHPSLQ